MKFILFIILIKFIFVESLENNLNNMNENFNTLENKKMTLSKSSMKFRSKFKSLFSTDLKKNPIDIEKLNSDERYQGFPLVKVEKDRVIGNGPFYFQGWGKYFTIEGKSAGNQMKEFNNNLAFNLEQLNRDKSKDSTMFIPDIKHFYFVLTDEFLNAITSRFVNKFFIFRMTLRALLKHFSFLLFTI